MKALPSPRLAIATPELSLDAARKALAKFYKLGDSYAQIEAMFASEAFKQAYALAYPLTGQNNAS